MIDVRPSETSLEAGFSLVEVIVSLAIISLIAGIAMPSAVRMTERFETRRQVESVKVLIESQSELAISSDRVVVLNSEKTKILIAEADLSQEAEVIVPEPLRFSPAGICNEATVELELGSDVAYRLQLNPLTCELESEK